MAVTADDGVQLAGTLTLPDGPGPHPAMLFLPGSGPVDRNSDAGQRMRLDLGGPLAVALAARGVASYRYDRRGVGATPGDWKVPGFVRNRDDAAGALRALSVRGEISAVGVVGHSEGAMHAAWLGAHGGAAAVVLLACPAGTGEEVLLWQAGQVAGDLPAPVRFVLRLLGRSVVEQQARTLAKIKRTTTDVARVGGAKVNARWLREMLVHDLRPDLAAIRVPVLAITGTKDVQVDPADLEVIAATVPGEVETRLVPDLTHLLRRDPGPASMRTYKQQLREPVDAALLDEVAQWAAARLAP